MIKKQVLFWEKDVTFKTSSKSNFHFPNFALISHFPLEDQVFEKNERFFLMCNESDIQD